LISNKIHDDEDDGGSVSSWDFTWINTLHALVCCYNRKKTKLPKKLGITKMKGSIQEIYTREDQLIASKDSQKNTKTKQKPNPRGENIYLE
jgi:hypothetical protein